MLSSNATHMSKHAHSGFYQQYLCQIIWTTRNQILAQRSSAFVFPRNNWIRERGVQTRVGSSSFIAGVDFSQGCIVGIILARAPSIFFNVIPHQKSRVIGVEQVGCFLRAICRLLTSALCQVPPRHSTPLVATRSMPDEKCYRRPRRMR